MEKLSPSIELYVWTIVNWVLLLSAFLYIVYFVFKHHKGLFKSRSNSLIIPLIGTALLFQSCEKEVYISNEVQQLVDQYNLVRSPNVTPENAISFTSVHEARLLLEALKNNDLNNPLVKDLVLKGIKRKDQRELLLQSMQGSKGAARISGGPCPGAGVAVASTSFMPWNNLNVSVGYNNGQVTNVSTNMSGMTFPLGVTQGAYQQTGYSASTNRYTVEVAVTIGANLFLEGLGTMWSQDETLIVDIDPCGGGDASSIRRKIRRTSSF